MEESMQEMPPSPPDVGACQIGCGMELGNAGSGTMLGWCWGRCTPGCLRRANQSQGTSCSAIGSMVKISSCAVLALQRRLTPGPPQTLGRLVVVRCPCEVRMPWRNATAMLTHVWDIYTAQGGDPRERGRCHSDRRQERIPTGTENGSRAQNGPKKDP
ncbi:hypothetical protein OH77DRAFT_239275 [Trametes cingulata]|nr:hypothetical protein OH77DRAFT_239275 [Trametes cingulata]